MAHVRSAIEVFDELETRLKVISGSSKALVVGKQRSFSRKAGSSNLPLKVDNVTCLSPSLRYTSLHPPLPKSRQASRVAQPLEVMVRFERSNGWPDNLKALRAAKTAFLIQICRSMEDFNTASGDANKPNKHSKKEVVCYPNHGFADVWLKGYVFRLRIMVEKEAALVPWPTEIEEASNKGNKKKGSFPVLSQDPLTASGNGALSPEDMQRQAKMVKFGHKKMLSSEVENIARMWGAYAPIPQRWCLRVTNHSLPQHHSLIHGLSVAQRAYSPSLRLVLRWLAQHHLSQQMPAPLVELLVAHAFFHGRGACISQSTASTPATKKLASGLGVGVEGVPSSALHGLHRFLLLLSTHEWEDTPLIVQPDPYEHSTKIASRSKGEDEETSTGQGKSMGLSSDDRRAIQKVYDQLKSIPPLSKETQQQVGHASVASMWVVAPYDRAHGWLSSWGILHEKAASVESACFPGIGENDELTSATLKSKTTGFNGDSGFNGVEKAVLYRIKAAAKQSLLYLDEWIRFNATSVKASKANQPEVWKLAFISKEPRISLGASLKLQVNSKLVPSIASDELASGCELHSAWEEGPSGLRMKTQYSNLRGKDELLKDSHQVSESFLSQQLVGMRPLEQVLATLRSKYGHLALFFVNSLYVNTEGDSQGIYVVWRPSVFLPSSFRIMESAQRIRIDTDELFQVKRVKQAPSEDDVDPFEAPHGPQKKTVMVGVPDIVAITKEMIAVTEGVVEKCIFL